MTIDFYSEANVLRLVLCHPREQAERGIDIPLLVANQFLGFTASHDDFSFVLES